MAKSKKKIMWQQYIGFVFYLFIGAACGILMANYLDVTSERGNSIGNSLFSLVLLLLGMYVAMFLQIIIHEAGHLFFGLLTGYKFSSFRVGSFMWIKKDGKIHFKRFSLAGTGGQCLMVPPDMVNGKMPFVLYNLGGSIFNVISGVIFLGLYFICKEIPFLSAIFMIISLIGFAYALMNGIPMRLATVDNDGYNTLSLSKDSKALRSLWVQMKANEQISRGVRLKDMPKEWFEVPAPEEMKNSMTAVLGVFACNRLLDAHEFEKANELIKELLHMDTAIIGLHRSLLTCDCIYCELISDNHKEKLEEMMDKKQKSFMKSMKKYPPILRTEYSYALLWEKDIQKANNFKEQFEKCAKTYPYESDVESERELMVIADNIK